MDPRFGIRDDGARGGAEFTEHGFASGGGHGSVHMAGGEAGEMIADAFGAVAREGRSAGDGAVISTRKPRRRT